MDEATIALTIMTLLILGIFLGLLIWGIRSRQFHNIEEPKYRIFHDGEDNSTEKRKEDAGEKR